MTVVDLRTTRLDPGEQDRAEYDVALESFVLGGEEYSPEPACPRAVLTISQLATGRLFELEAAIQLVGPCMRCLEEAREPVTLDLREYQASSPDGSDDLTVSYLEDEKLDLSAWVRDEVALALPEQVVCRAACAGMCGSCGADLNTSECTCPPPEPDSRWAKLADFPREARKI